NINRVIVLIDDLDRCNPDTIISTLEAIKLFLFVDKSIFIISADERLINYAVKQKFPELPSTDYDVSKDYVEKLIHFPIRIPSMSESEYETYINLLFSKLHLKITEFDELTYKVFNASRKDGDILNSKLNSENISDLISKVPEELKQDLILSKQINPILVSILSGNPRQCKRFLNMLMIRLNMAKSKGIELKKNVLAKLMLLEYFKTESFNKLVKTSYEDDDNILKRIENTQDNEEHLDDSFDGWKNDV
ncbi:MAG: NTPase, partial [Ignavibacteriae bacterium]|nr:NTPase [Ignavibacteriota bacterium]